MSFKTGTTTFGSTGVKTFTTTFLPKRVEIFVGALFGGPESLNHFCIGRSDGTNQSCNWQFNDGALIECDNSSTKMISVWENVAGVMTEVLSATFNSFNATSVKFNCTIANAGYQIFVSVSD